MFGAGGRSGVRLTNDSGGFGRAQLNMLLAQLEFAPELWQPVEITKVRPQAIQRLRENLDMLLRIT